MFKFSLNWLRDYCGKESKFEDIMQKLKLQGFEFQGSQNVGNDIVTAIEVKANRPDMLCHMGIAREIKAFDLEKAPEIIHKDIKSDNASFPIKINVDKNVCKRFCAVKISGADTSKQTPKYIKERLGALGINSVNSVVDIGNYVMLDVGQPIHAYDFDKLSKKELNIYRAEKDEKVVTFSGETSEIKAGDIVISDASGIKCIAGIIGTQDAAVSEDTKNIILEAAVFDDVSIRLTSRRLKISTPSSFRFERGVSAGPTLDILMNCAEMITKICGGKVENCIFDYIGAGDEEKFLNLSVKNSNRIIGVSLDQKTIIEYLERYSFKCVSKDEDTIKVTTPDCRLDVKQEVDLIEEIARIHGYDNIEPVMPTIMTSYNKNTIWSNIDILREVLAGFGFHETINYSFIPDNTMKTFGISEGGRLYSDLILQNPIAGAYSLMRPFMAHSLLSCLIYNYSISNNNLGLFELGKVYFKDDKYDTGCKEINTCGFIMSGVRIPRGFGINKDVKYNYYDLLSYLKIIMDRFGMSFDFALNNFKFLVKGSGYDIIVNGKKIGFIGEINKSQLSKMQNLKLVKDNIFYCEFYLEDIEEKVKKIKFESKYPPVNRLYNFIQKKDISAKQVEDIIKSSDEIVRNVVVNDIYTDKTFSESEHAVLYEVNYCSKNETLTHEKIEVVEAKFIKELSEKFNVKFKS